MIKLDFVRERIFVLFGVPLAVSGLLLLLMDFTTENYKIMPLEMKLNVLGIMYLGCIICLAVGIRLGYMILKEDDENGTN